MPQPPARERPIEIKMVLLAHAGHWSLGLLEALPVLVVATFALWKSRTADPHGSGGADPDTTHSAAAMPEPHAGS